MCFGYAVFIHFISSSSSIISAYLTCLSIITLGADKLYFFYSGT